MRSLRDAWRRWRDPFYGETVYFRGVETMSSGWPRCPVCGSLLAKVCGAVRIWRGPAHVCVQEYPITNTKTGYPRGVSQPSETGPSTDLEPVHPAQVDPALSGHDALDIEVARNIRGSRAEATWTAYSSDWGHFTRWCNSRGDQALPAEPLTVARYISDLARDGDGRTPVSPSTIGRRLSAIRAAHEHHNQPIPTFDPLVVRTRAGINRRLKVAPRNRKRDISTDDLRAACQAMGGRLIDHRDRALLLVGFAGGFRRSELAALDVADIRDRPEGLDIFIGSSKRDQEGEGANVAIVYGDSPDTCPVRALRRWLGEAYIKEGPVFRAMGKGDRVGLRISGHSIARVVKRHMAPLGHDITEFSGHSLRRGMATTASRNGAPDRTIMATTRHAKVDSLTPYVEDGRRFHDPASGYLGL